MAQTSSALSTSTLQWLRFFRLLSHQQAGLRLNLEQYAWYLSLDAWPEHNPYLRLTGDGEAVSGASARAGAGADSGAGADASIILQVDKPRQSVCPMPSSALASWLEPGWNDADLAEPHCSQWRLEVTLQVDALVVDKLQAPALLSADEYQVLSGQKTFIAGPYRSITAKDYQPPQIVPLRCERYTSNAEWVAALQGKPALISYKKFDEDKSLAAWLLQRQAWLQVRRTETDAARIYQQLQMAYAAYTQASGEMELCLTNGLLRVATFSDKSETASESNLVSDSEVVDTAGAEAAQFERAREVTQPKSQPLEQEDELESLLDAKSRSSSQLAFVNWAVSHPLVLRPVRLEFDERLERFTVYALNVPSQLYMPGLAAAVESVGAQALRESSGSNSSSGGEDSLYGLDSAFGLGKLAELFELEQMQAQVANVTPLSKAAVLRILEDIGSKLPKCLVTPQLISDPMLLQRYACQLAVAPGLLLRPAVSLVDAQLSALEDYVQRGGLLSAPAYTLMQQSLPRAVAESVGAWGSESESAFKSESLSPDFTRLGSERLELVLSQPLNAQQQSVVSSQPVVVAQAPTGTGKSYTAAALISLALSRGLRILVTSSRYDVLQAVVNYLPPTLRNFCCLSPGLNAGTGSGSSLGASSSLSTSAASAASTAASSNATSAVSPASSEAALPLASLPALPGQLTPAQYNELVLQVEQLKTERTNLFQQLLERRHKIFNWLNLGNIVVEYQGEQYTCAQLDDFVKEQAALAKLIPFTPQLDAKPAVSAIPAAGKDAALAGEAEVESSALVLAEQSAQKTKLDEPGILESGGSEIVDSDKTNVAAYDATVETSSLDSKFKLVALPLSQDELKELYATNESIPAQYESLLELSWPEVRFLPQPTQFLDLLQILSKLQQSLDQGRSWQVDLNLAQDLALLKPRIAPAQALFGSKLNLRLDSCKSEAASSLLMGQLNKIPSWISTVYSVGAASQTNQQTQSQALAQAKGYASWLKLAQLLMELQRLQSKLGTKLDNRRLELHPQYAQHLEHLQQLESALVCIVQHLSGAQAHACDASSAQADNEAGTTQTAQDASALSQAFVLLEKVVRLERQAVQGLGDTTLVLDYVRLQLTKLQSLKLWQELVEPLGGGSLGTEKSAHVAVSSASTTSTASAAASSSASAARANLETSAGVGTGASDLANNGDIKLGVAWDEAGRLGYLIHWVLHWVNQRSLVLTLWQERFKAVGWQGSLNLHNSDPKSSTLQTAVAMFTAFQLTCQEAANLSLQAVRYYRYCLSYNRVLKLLNQEQFKTNPCCSLLLQALTQRQPPLYAKAYKQMQQVVEYQALYARRLELLERLASVAPDWAHAIAKRQGEHGKAQDPQDLALAWQYWQFAQCLAQLTSNSQSRLSQHLTPLKTKFYEVSTQYIAKQSYLNLVPQPQNQLQTQPLPQLESQAQAPSELSSKQAYESLPVWIKPWFEVISFCQVTKTHFDIVVVDEAQRLPYSGAALVLFNLASQVVLLANPESVGWELLNSQPSSAVSTVSAASQAALNARMGESADEKLSPSSSVQSLAQVVTPSGWAMPLQTAVSQLMVSHLRNSAPSSNLDSVTARQEPEAGVKPGVKSVAAPTLGWPGCALSIWQEQFTALPQLVTLMNQAIVEQSYFKLQGLRWPRWSSLSPSCLVINAGDQALPVLAALLQACVEQSDYTAKTFGILLSDAAALDFSSMLLGNLQLMQGLKSHQLRYGTAQAFTGSCCDVMFALLDESLDLAAAIAHTAEQLWVISALDVAKLPTSAPSFKLLDYAGMVQNQFAADPADLKFLVSSLLRQLQQLPNLDPRKLKFMQSLVQMLSERGFQLKLSSSLALGSLQEDMITSDSLKGAALSEDVPSKDTPSGLIVLYQQRRLYLECHLESELSHPQSVLEIMQRHEQYEHAGFTVLHILCSAQVANVIEQLVQQLQREGFYPESLRGFIQVLLHQSSLVLLHKLQKRVQELLQKSGAKYQVSLWGEHLQAALAKSRQAQAQTQALAFDSASSLDQDAGQPNLLAGKAEQNAKESASDRAVASKANANKAQQAQDGAYGEASSTDMVDESYDKIEQYDPYVPANPAQQQELTSELERIMTQREQEQSAAAYASRHSQDADALSGAQDPKSQASSFGLGSGSSSGSEPEDAAKVQAQYNYALARLGLRHIAQPMPDPLPADPHERFRAFKRFLFGILKQLHLAYMDLLSSYQIVAVTPSTGQDHIFLRLCETLRLRPYIYSAQQPMAKRVWCIRQSDLMSPYAIEAACALSKGEAGASDVEAQAAESAYERASSSQAQSSDQAQSGIVRPLLPPMAEGDSNSPLVAALNRALNPYWGQMAASEHDMQPASTMQAVQRRRALSSGQTWEPPRSTNQFLKEQLLPPPFRRSLNREDVNTLAVLSMIPKQTLPPKPAKARLHTLRVTKGKNAGSVSPANASGSTHPSAIPGAALSAYAASDDASSQTSRQRLARGYTQESSSAATTFARYEPGDLTERSGPSVQAESTDLLKQPQAREAETNATKDEAGTLLSSAYLSDSSLKAAAKQLEDANRSEGEFALSSIFNLPEVSSALSSSLAAASDLMNGQSAQASSSASALSSAQAPSSERGLEQANTSKASAYPVYGAGAAANVRVKRAGAVDYPGMPSLSTTNTTSPDSGMAGASKKNRLGRTRSDVIGRSLDAFKDVRDSQAHRANPQGNASSLAPERFNADAAVAELLFKLDQENAAAANTATTSANARSTATLPATSQTMPAVRRTGASTTASSSEAGDAQQPKDQLVVRGSILGIGSMDEDWAAIGGEANLPSTNLPSAVVNSPVSATALGRFGKQSPSHTLQMPRLNASRPRTAAASVAGVQALSQAAYGYHSPRGTGSVRQADATTSATSANAAGRYQATILTPTQVARMGGAPASSAGYASSERSGYGGAYGVSRDLGAGQTGALSSEQLSYLAMLLQRSEIWFKQSGTSLQVKVLPSQARAFQGICNAMHLKPRLISSGQGVAAYNEWRFG